MDPARDDIDISRLVNVNVSKQLEAQNRPLEEIRLAMASIESELKRRAHKSAMADMLKGYGLMGEANCTRSSWVIKTHFPERLGWMKFPVRRAILLVRHPVNAPCAAMPVRLPSCTCCACFTAMPLAGTRFGARRGGPRGRRTRRGPRGSSPKVRPTLRAAMARRPPASSSGGRI